MGCAYVPKRQLTTYAWINAQIRGAINDFDSAVLTPKVPARAPPAPAKTRLSTQPKNVTICLRQYCSPSVKVILLTSVAKSRMKTTILMTAPSGP